MKEAKESSYEYPPCDADKEIEYLIRARYSMVYVVTWEEQRVLDSIHGICEKDNIGIPDIHVWDAGRGLTTYLGTPVTKDPLLTPEQILDHITREVEVELNLSDKDRLKASRGPVYVLCDMFRYLSGGDEGFPEIERKLRNLSSMLKHTSKFVIITSPELRLPTTLEKNLAVVDYPLPGSPQLRACVMAAKKILWSVKRISKEVYDSDPEPVIRSLMGLTLQEADDALAKSVVVKDCFDVGVLNDLKRQVVRKGELLDQIFTEETIDNIGGMQGIKEYLRLRKSSFGEDARAYGLTSPKGIFLLGVQGCGKSLCAKAVANEFQIPLLKLDMGRLFSSYVGESEGNVRRAIKIAEGIAPCVLFIDELDKAFSGTTGSQGDGGVTRRVIGSILDWMQEKKAPVFVVAASNSIDGIPPAVVRRGRFDERFFVDLPTRDERRVIFAIHLAKRGRDPAKFDLDSLASSSDNFSGAEIESVIEDAMRWAFADRKREFTTEDVVNECRVCVPLYVTMKDEIDGLRNGIVGRMRMANLPLRPDLPDEENKPLSRFEKL